MTLSVDSNDLSNTECGEALHDEMLDVGDLEGRDISRCINCSLDNRTQRKILNLLRKDLAFQELIADCVRQCRLAWFTHKDIAPILFSPDGLGKIPSSKSKTWKRDQLPLSSHKNTLSYATIARKSRGTQGRNIDIQRLTPLDKEIKDKICALLQDEEMLQELSSMRAASHGFFFQKQIDVLQSSKRLPLGVIKSINKFWKKHKTPILIGAGIAAVVGTILVITIFSAGTGAAAAAVAGGAALDKLNNPDSPPPPQPSPETKKESQSEETSPSPQPPPPPPSAPPPEPPTLDRAITPQRLVSDHTTTSNLATQLSPYGGGLIPNFPTEFQFMPMIDPRANIPPMLSSWTQSSFLSFCNREVSYPTKSTLRSEEIKPRSPSWLGRALNALKLVGEGIVDNPSLFNPTAPLPTKPDISLENGLLGALKLVGEGIVDSPFLLDPHVPLPIKPDISLTNGLLGALKLVGEGVVDSPFLLDPHAPLPTNPDIAFTKGVLGALKLIGEGIADNPLLFEPGTELITKPPTSSKMSVLGTFPDHVRIGGINGMNTLEIEKDSHMAYIAANAPEASMDWVYNHTHGAAVDLLEILTLNYNGISPNTADLLLQNWIEFHEKNKKNPNAKYLQFCHSQGAIHLKNALLRAPPEIRDRVIVIAIAPAAIVTDDLCHESYNYACTSDLVPYGEVFAAMLNPKTFTTYPTPNQNPLLKALEDHKEIIWLDAPPGSSGLNHDFQNIVFQEKIQQHINEYIKLNGNYK